MNRGAGAKHCVTGLRQQSSSSPFNFYYVPSLWLLDFTAYLNCAALFVWKFMKQDIGEFYRMALEVSLLRELKTKGFGPSAI